METLIIKVAKMECVGCERRIQNSLKTIDGVSEVTADFKEGLVTVKKDKNVDKNVIYERIENLGFEVIKDM